MNTKNKKLCLGPLLVCHVIITYRQKMARLWESGQEIKTKEAYSKQSVPSGQPGGLVSRDTVFFCHKDQSDKKRMWSL